MSERSLPDAARDPTGHAASTTIWIDMTTLLRWRWTMVGVVRVEQQLARWLLSRGERVRFCRYDEATGSHVEVARDEVAAQTEFLERAGRGAPRPPKPPKPRKRKKHRSMFGKVFRFVRKSARRAAGICAGLLARARAEPAHARVEHHGSGPTPAVLRAGDVYVSVGGDWDDNDLGQLYKRKRRDGFMVLGFCYDMIPVKFPHLTIPDTDGKFARHVANLAWTADHVLCISKCSEKDLIEAAAMLQCPRPETSVIRLGSDLPAAGGPDDGAQDQRSPNATAVAEATASPFVLYVSTIERRKNHETLYRAWVRLIEAGHAIPNLVFVGKRGWRVDDFLSDLANDQRIRGRIHVLDGVSDGELAMLYDRCLYTVYPSLYEGWGLPILESFRFGKFCLCSDGGSLPEAGGDLAEYLDPWDLYAWMDRIRYFADHPDEIRLRNQKVARLFRPDSWQDTCRSIMHKARELAERGARRSS